MSSITVSWEIMSINWVAHCSESVQWGTASPRSRQTGHAGRPVLSELGLPYAPAAVHHRTYRGRAAVVCKDGIRPTGGHLHPLWSMQCIIGHTAEAQSYY